MRPVNEQAHLLVTTRDSGGLKRLVLRIRVPNRFLDQLGSRRLRVDVAPPLVRLVPDQHGWVFVRNPQSSVAHRALLSGVGNAMITPRIEDGAIVLDLPPEFQAVPLGRTARDAGGSIRSRAVTHPTMLRRVCCRTECGQVFRTDSPYLRQCPRCRSNANDISTYAV